MKLIKLTSPELIEEFFNGEESVEVSEPCKIVSDSDRIISETGALVMLVDGVIKFRALGELPEVKAEVKIKKSTKKK